MTCAVVSGGAFEHACRAFLAESPVVLYHDWPTEEEPARTTRKTQYACPNCTVRAWAKPDVLLRCGLCDRPLTVTLSKRALPAARRQAHDLPAAPVGEVRGFL